MGDVEQDTAGVCCAGADGQVTTLLDCHDLGGDFYLGHTSRDPHPYPALAQWLVCEVESMGTGDYMDIQAAIGHGSDEIEPTDGTYQGGGNRDINSWSRDIVVHPSGDDPSACVPVYRRFLACWYWSLKKPTIAFGSGKSAAFADAGSAWPLAQRLARTGRPVYCRESSAM